jgi:hypothetical protein
MTTNAVSVFGMTREINTQHVYSSVLDVASEWRVRGSEKRSRVSRNSRGSGLVKSQIVAELTQTPLYFPTSVTELGQTYGASCLQRPAPRHWTLQVLFNP